MIRNGFQHSCRSRAFSALANTLSASGCQALCRPDRGRICLGKKKINFSTVFAGQAVGIREVHDDIWLVSFMDYDLGYFDLETRVLEPLENPFGPKVFAHVAGTKC